MSVTFEEFTKMLINLTKIKHFRGGQLKRIDIPKVLDKWA